MIEFDELLERETTCTADIIASTIFRFSCGQIIIFFVLLTPWGLFHGTQIFQSNPLSCAGDSRSSFTGAGRSGSSKDDLGPIPIWKWSKLPKCTIFHIWFRTRSPKTSSNVYLLSQTMQTTCSRYTNYYLHIYTTKKVRKDNRGREEKS